MNGQVAYFWLASVVGWETKSYQHQHTYELLAAHMNDTLETYTLSFCCLWWEKPYSALVKICILNFDCEEREDLNYEN